ncbi:hypothetical protein BT63DRAFT_190627 [Microthyrium microscopicum]|uniref:Aminoglycoside phosphotransferase domain-containing protein n=1 Tax=Microthyrium microscopicum TaxID=703497 RepID=A0A6A6UM76_9PEZI|nr:hypothetical protein BT63DRAFT_190627 [Microthyrium microscopicum]
MPKIPGRQLETAWIDLSHAQRVKVATDIGNHLREMMRRTFSRGGVLRPDSFPNNYTGDGALIYDDWWGYKIRTTRKVLLQVQSPFVDGKKLPILDNDLTAVMPPLIAKPRALIDTLLYRIEILNRCFLVPPRLLLMVKEMLCEIHDRTELFNTNYYLFAHGDFYPRNLLEKDGEITAVIDWDLAKFEAPVEACRTPTWLWMWQRYRMRNNDGPESQWERYLDTCSWYTPNTDEELEIKHAFEKAVGTQFLYFANHKETNLARKIIEWINIPHMIENPDVQGEIEREHRKWQEMAALRWFYAGFNYDAEAELAEMMKVQREERQMEWQQMSEEDQMKAFQMVQGQMEETYMDRAQMMEAGMDEATMVQAQMEAAQMKETQMEETLLEAVELDFTQLVFGRFEPVFVGASVEDAEMDEADWEDVDV